MKTQWIVDQLYFLTQIVPLKRNLDHKSFFSLDRYVNVFIQIISFFERSSFKLKWCNREFTLKCEFKCYVKPMKDPLGVSPSKGNQGTTRGKGKIFLTSVGVGKVTVDLIRRSWVRFPPGPDSHRGQKNFFFTSCGSLIPFTRANTQWVFRGLHIALKFTLQS